MNKTQTIEETEAIVRVVANMVFRYNGSDETNPPMSGMRYAVRTLEEYLRQKKQQSLKEILEIVKQRELANNPVKEIVKEINDLLGEHYEK